jgi:hypothetical protein
MPDQAVPPRHPRSIQNGPTNPFLRSLPAPTTHSWPIRLSNSIPDRLPLTPRSTTRVIAVPTSRSLAESVLSRPTIRLWTTRTTRLFDSSPFHSDYPRPVFPTPTLPNRFYPGPTIPHRSIHSSPTRRIPTNPFVSARLTAHGDPALLDYSLRVSTTHLISRRPASSSRNSPEPSRQITSPQIAPTSQVYPSQVTTLGLSPLPSPTHQPSP